MMRRPLPALTSCPTADRGVPGPSEGPLLPLRCQCPCHRSQPRAPCTEPARVLHFCAWDVWALACTARILVLVHSGPWRQRQSEWGSESHQAPYCLWETGQAQCSYDCVLFYHLRFLEQRREITEKFVAEQDAVLREAREEHSRELQLLQDRHQQHVASLTAELQAQHQADTVELRALSEARVTALQTEHAAEIRALESRHASDLESVEAHWRSEVEALGEEHRRALQLLRGDPGGQLRGVTWELENVHWKQDAELQSTESSPGVEPAERAEGLRAHQVRRAPQTLCRVAGDALMRWA